MEGHTEEAEVAALKRRFDDHLVEHAEFRSEYSINQIRHETAYTKNMEAIAALTKSTQEVVQSTQGVVDAWKVANGFQKFVKWLSGFVFLGAIIKFLSEKLP